MKVKEYLKELQDLVNEDPSLLEVDMIVQEDDEGNGYHPIKYAPDIVFVEKGYAHFIEDVYSEDDEYVEEDHDSYVKVVLI